jgi:hypothetical protein
VSSRPRHTENCLTVPLIFSLLRLDILLQKSQRQTKCSCLPPMLRWLLSCSRNVVSRSLPVSCSVGFARRSVSDKIQSHRMSGLKLFATLILLLQRMLTAANLPRLGRPLSSISKIPSVTLTQPCSETTPPRRSSFHLEGLQLQKTFKPTSNLI